MSRNMFMVLILALLVLMGLPTLAVADGPTDGQRLTHPVTVPESAGTLQLTGLASSLLALTPSTTPTAIVRIEFEGMIREKDESQTPPVWNIGGLPVEVPETAEIDEERGPAVEGAWVKVEALLYVGEWRVVAEEIIVKRSPGAEECFRVEFYGELTEIRADRDSGQEVWTVNDRTVIITADTNIEGNPAVGATVKVEGCLQIDETVIAREVKVRPRPDLGDHRAEFRGRIVSIDEANNQWQVGRWTVIIIPDSTQIVGDPPRVGAFAEVKGHTNDQGQVVAEWIEVKDRGPGGDRRPSRVRIEGYITDIQLDPETTIWFIENIPVKITQETVISGVPPRAGDVWAMADVIEQRNPAAAGLQQNDMTYVAVRIRTRFNDEPAGALKFNGIIGSMNDDDTWVVSGWTFDVSSAEIEGTPAVGAWVEIKATHTDNAYVANKVEVEEGSNDHHPRPNGGVKIEGRITAKNDAEHQLEVEHIPVQLDRMTVVDTRKAAAEVGNWAEVWALARDGQPFLALRVKMDDEPDLEPGQLRFEGQLDEQPESGPWIVSGWSFVVDDETRIEGSPAVGDRVELKATWTEGQHHADEIEAKGRHD